MDFSPKIEYTVSVNTSQVDPCEQPSDIFYILSKILQKFEKRGDFLKMMVPNVAEIKTKLLLI